MEKAFVVNAKDMFVRKRKAEQDYHRKQIWNVFLGILGMLLHMGEFIYTIPEI